MPALVKRRRVARHRITKKTVKDTIERSILRHADKKWCICEGNVATGAHEGAPSSTGWNTSSANGLQSTLVGGYWSNFFAPGSSTTAAVFTALNATTQSAGTQAVGAGCYYTALGEQASAAGRIGDRIRIKHISFKYKMRMHWLASNVSCIGLRVVMFWDRAWNGVAAPGDTSTNMLCQGSSGFVAQAPAVFLDQTLTSIRSPMYKSRYHVIYDRTHMFCAGGSSDTTGNNDCMVVGGIEVPTNTLTLYGQSNGITSDIQKNALFCGIWSDTTLGNTGTVGDLYCQPLLVLTYYDD